MYIIHDQFKGDPWIIYAHSWSEMCGFLGRRAVLILNAKWKWSTKVLFLSLRSSRCPNNEPGKGHPGVTAWKVSSCLTVTNTSPTGHETLWGESDLGHLTRWNHLLVWNVTDYITASLFFFNSVWIWELLETWWLSISRQVCLSALSKSTKSDCPTVHEWRWQFVHFVSLTGIKVICFSQPCSEFADPVVA